MRRHRICTRFGRSHISWHRAHTIPLGAIASTLRAFKGAKEKEACGIHRARAAARCAAKACSPRTLLSLPDLQPPPAHLVRDGLQYTHCKHCTLYVAAPRFLVHEEICRHVSLRPKLAKPSPVSRVAYAPVRPNARVRALVVANREWVACDICHCGILAKNLARRVRRAHKQLWQERGAPEVSPPAHLTGDGQRLSRCAQCGKYFESEHMLTHTRVCTWRSSKRRQSAQSDEALEQAPTARPLLGLSKKKEQPKKQVNTASVRMVLKRAVKAQTTAVRGASSAHAAKTNKPSLFQQSSRVSEEGTMMASPDRSSDASRFVGYFARENGHFGSMPSYDGYDDESGAD